MDKIHVGVCIPSGESWKAHFATSVVMMFVGFLQSRVPGMKEQRLSLINTRGSMLSQSRDSLVDMALKKECTHILFLDSDMTFPPDTLNRLLAHKKAFVGTNCVIKKIPSETTAIGMAGTRIFSDPDKHGLEEVIHTGMAVTLLSCDLVKGFEKPRFLMEWSKKHDAYAGEDVYFCHRLRERGARLYVDHDLSREVGHVGDLIYTHDYVGEIKKMEVA